MVVVGQNSAFTIQKYSKLFWK